MRRGSSALPLGSSVAHARHFGGCEMHQPRIARNIVPQGRLDDCRTHRHDATHNAAFKRWSNSEFNLERDIVRKYTYQSSFLKIILGNIIAGISERGRLAIWESEVKYGVSFHIELLFSDFVQLRLLSNCFQLTIFGVHSKLRSNLLPE